MPEPWLFAPLLQELHLYLDHRLDESYTPSRVSVRAGNSYQDLKAGRGRAQLRSQHMRSTAGAPPAEAHGRKLTWATPSQARVCSDARSRLEHNVACWLPAAVCRFAIRSGEQRPYVDVGRDPVDARRRLRSWTWWSPAAWWWCRSVPRRRRTCRCAPLRCRCAQHIRVAARLWAGGQRPWFGMNGVRAQASWCGTRRAGCGAAAVQPATGGSWNPCSRRRPVHVVPLEPQVAILANHQNGRDTHVREVGRLEGAVNAPVCAAVMRLHHAPADFGARSRAACGALQRSWPVAHGPCGPPGG
jgi:hypothetical protein